MSELAPLHLGAASPEPEAAGSVGVVGRTYVEYGRSECTSSAAELVYSGLVATGYQGHTGGGDGRGIILATSVVGCAF